MYKTVVGPFSFVRGKRGIDTFEKYYVIIVMGTGQPINFNKLIIMRFHISMRDPYIIIINVGYCII